MASVATKFPPLPPMIVFCMRDVLNDNAAIAESYLIWSEKFRAVIDCGLETLKTNTSSVPAFQIPPNWETCTRDKREEAVATAIVRNIRNQGGDFYQYDLAANSWGLPISNGAAIAHVRIPLTAQYINKWKDYIETSGDIGLVTLIWFHQTTGPSQWTCNLSKIPLIHILAAQFIIPILLACMKWSDYQHLCYAQGFDKGFFPKGEAWVANQTLACTVAVIFLFRLAILGMQRFLQVDHSLLTKTSSGGILMKTVIWDRFIFFVYEPGVYLINLWTIFLEPDAKSIVKSVAAMIFLLRLSDSFKTKFIKVFPPDIDTYMKFNNESVKKPTSLGFM